MTDRKKTKETEEAAADDFTIVVEKTLKNIDEDRSRISGILDDIIVALKKDPESSGDKLIFAAQSLAKIADSLVKNNQLQVSVAALLKRPGGAKDQKEDPVSAAIGKFPFQPVSNDDN